MLVRDGRATVAEIAAAVGRSESAVRERLAQLEAQQVVRGYTTRLDHAGLGLAVRAQVRARCDLRRLRDLTARLAAVPEVLEVRLTTGQRAIVIDLCTRSMEELERVLSSRIAALELEALEVEVTLQTLLEHRAPALLEQDPARERLLAAPAAVAPRSA